MKQRQRDLLTKERQTRMATGFGPSSMDVEVDPYVAHLTPGLLVEIEGTIDSDSVYSKTSGFISQLL